MNKEIEILPIYFDWLINKKYPINVLVGGRNSGKSYFMEQLATINTHNADKVATTENVLFAAAKLG